MNVLNITVGDTAVSLRLTASKLQEYIKNYSNEAQSPLLAVLDAMDSLKNQAALFTSALQYKGNLNLIKDGYELLDKMADAGLSPMDRKGIIIDLAEQSGLVDAEDATAVRKSIEKGNRKFIETVAVLLAGDRPSVDNASATEEAPSEDAHPAEENPT